VSLVDDYNKIELGRKLNDWKKTIEVNLVDASVKVDGKTAVMPNLVHCQDLIDKMIAMKIESPGDSVEIEVLISEKQTAVDTFVSDNSIVLPEK
tara:strand:+ start:2160 stop:2441 length:282 start_codon:yes stop_codon:yes gene_type:complete